MTELVTRRGAVGLGFAVAGLAVTSCAGRAAAQPVEAPPPKDDGRPLSSSPVQHLIVDLPFDAGKLDGLSEKLLTLHHDKNYAGAVKKLNFIRGKLRAADPSQAGSYWSEYGTLKAGEAAARNSALLHELYFANLIGPGRRPPARIAKVLADRFGGVDAAVDRMKACGKASSGWVVLALDAASGTIEIVPTDGHRGGAWHAEALIVLDMFEHSYALDYGPDKAGYLEAFFENLHWDEVDRRLAAALRGPTDR